MTASETDVVVDGADGAPPVRGGGAVRRVLVTGMSGTGKSSVLRRLAAGGCRVVDTDEPGWHEQVVLDPAYGPEQVWRADRVGALLDGAGARPLVVSGTPSNLGGFLDRFEAVVLLSAPLEVLLDRVAARTTNPYGRHPAQRARIAADLAEVEPLLRRVCTHELDAARPLAQVVADVEAVLTSLP